MARTRSKKGKGPRIMTKALEGEETPAKDDHSRKEKDDEVESETTAADVINLKFERFFDLPDGNQNKILKMLSELDTVTLSTAMSNKAKRAMLNQRFDDVYRINYEFESIAMLQWIYKCCKIDLVDFRVDIQMKLNEIGRNHITSNLMLFEFLAKKSVSATTAYPDSIQCTLELARLVSTRGHDFDVDRFQDRSVIQPGGDMLRSAPLHQAAGLGQVEIVRMLVFEAGADKNIRDSRGWSALQWACSYGQVDITRILAMHARCNANSQDDRGATALHYAAASGSFECSRILAVDAQADCSIGTVGGTTAVMYASVEGMVDCLKLLVKQPTANVNQQSKDGRSALHFACQNNGHFLAARCLVHECGANIDAVDIDGQSPMHFAVSPFNVETVEMLLSANANLLLRDNHGQTAVDIAEAAADHDPIVLEKMIKAFTYQEQAASLMNILLT